MVQLIINILRFRADYLRLRLGDQRGAQQPIKNHRALPGDVFLRPPGSASKLASLRAQKNRLAAVLDWLRFRADSNCCRSFCRALPSHSATEPYPKGTPAIPSATFFLSGCEITIILKKLKKNSQIYASNR